LSNSYGNSVSTTEIYLNSLYSSGFFKSKYLSDDEVVEVCNRIGVFKLKGYIKELKHSSSKNIDEALIMYLFDKFFSKILFDLTIRIESKLKSILVSECYKKTNNHFFYLIKANHKWSNYKIDFPTIKNWKTHTTTLNPIEAYSHYILYYLQNYDFNLNKIRYLGSNTLINIDSLTYNYPPFKYLIESATLGSVISFIESLQIRKNDINKLLSPYFGLGKNITIFSNYLERLKEIRNRVAHGGRIFNRTFRSATGIGKFHSFRVGINNHKSMDVYLFLFFMLNQLEDFNDIKEFKKYQIEKLFREFKKDYISNKDSFKLVKKYKRKDFDNMKKFIYSKMSR
jgi:abortive infection bacteriophage resistance protein